LSLQPSPAIGHLDAGTLTMRTQAHVAAPRLLVQNLQRAIRETRLGLQEVPDVLEERWKQTVRPCVRETQDKAHQILHVAVLRTERDHLQQAASAAESSRAG
jgi:hypothetical protein